MNLTKNSKNYCLNNSIKLASVKDVIDFLENNYVCYKIKTKRLIDPKTNREREMFVDLEEVPLRIKFESDLRNSLISEFNETTNINKGNTKDVVKKIYYDEFKIDSFNGIDALKRILGLMDYVFLDIKGNQLFVGEQNYIRFNKELHSYAEKNNLTIVSEKVIESKINYNSINMLKNYYSNFLKE